MALVTGASSGIGLATARRLCEEGWRVFAAVRAEDEMADVAKQVPDASPVVIDVRDGGSIAAVSREVEEQAGEGLHGLVNNAGIPICGPLEAISPALLRETLEVNVTGQLRVMQAFLPMLRRAQGRVLFMGSLGGRVAFPFAGPYHTSKFALEGMAESLRAELIPQGVGVSILEPGPISTPIWEKARTQLASLREGLEPEMEELYGSQLDGFDRRLRSADQRGAGAESVAAAVVRALSEDSPRARYPIGAPAWAMIGLRPLVPGNLFAKLTHRITTRA